MFEIIGFIKSLGIKDLIEMAIVAYCIYVIINYFKNTRAFYALIGLGIILIVSIFSEWFNFELINWILSKLWLAIFVVIVILFQPEIRNALAVLAGKTIFKFFPAGSSRETVNKAIADAVKQMSGASIGALIVLKNKISLDEYIKTGVLIRAEVSKELLTTIFFPKTDLHDGAVIIDGNEIIAAGCILPLTDDNIDTKFGTRHRAAFGISKETDAGVIVVSEERGTISYVKDSKLRTNLNYDQLIDILRQ